MTNSRRLREADAARGSKFQIPSSKEAYFFFSCSFLDGDDGAVDGCGGGLMTTVGRAATGAAGCGCTVGRDGAGDGL